MLKGVEMAPSCLDRILIAIYIVHGEYEIWLGKILANEIRFTKFAKVFLCQNFAL